MAFNSKAFKFIVKLFNKGYANIDAETENIIFMIMAPKNEVSDKEIIKNMESMKELSCHDRRGHHSCLMLLHIAGAMLQNI